MLKLIIARKNLIGYQGDVVIKQDVYATLYAKNWIRSTRYRYIGMWLQSHTRLEG